MSHITKPLPYTKLWNMAFTKHTQYANDSFESSTPRIATQTAFGSFSRSTWLLPMQHRPFRFSVVFPIHAIRSSSFVSISLRGNVLFWLLFFPSHPRATHSLAPSSVFLIHAFLQKNSSTLYNRQPMTTPRPFRFRILCLHSRRHPHHPFPSAVLLIRAFILSYALVAANSWRCLLRFYICFAYFPPRASDMTPDAAGGSWGVAGILWG